MSTYGSWRADIVLVQSTNPITDAIVNDNLHKAAGLLTWLMGEGEDFGLFALNAQWWIAPET